MMHKLYSDEELEAYEAGRDYEANGATATNCPFNYLATDKLMKAWLAGKQAERNAA